MDYFFFDKDNCLVSISNSILKYFTGKCYHNTSTQLDEVFAQKRPDKVCVMLFDGFGKSIREKHLKENDFLRRKKAFTITSVFPPTTVAATTALITGKYPIETGWLGWRQYFASHDVTVDMFTNANSVPHEKIKGPSLSYLYCPITPIWELIDSKEVKAGVIYPHPISLDGPKTLKEFFSCASNIMKRDEKHFYYMYWNEPDSSMHKFGINDRRIKLMCKDINKRVARLANDNKDNLIIVLSDHSMVDTKYFNLYEHEDFADAVEHIYGLDARSCAFYVKDEYKDSFVSLFNKYYKDYFIIKTKEEVIKEGWFGEGTPHPLFESFIGDFLITSIKDYGFTYEKDYPLVANHAGSTSEESLIDVSIINN